MGAVTFTRSEHAIGRSSPPSFPRYLLQRGEIDLAHHADPLYHLEGDEGRAARRQRPLGRGDLVEGGDFFMEGILEPDVEARRTPTRFEAVDFLFWRKARSRQDELRVSMSLRRREMVANGFPGALGFCFFSQSFNNS